MHGGGGESVREHRNYLSSASKFKVKIGWERAVCINAWRWRGKCPRTPKLSLPSCKTLRGQEKGQSAERVSECIEI